jgi:hypothetical protein
MFYFRGLSLRRPLCASGRRRTIPAAALFALRCCSRSLRLRVSKVTGAIWRVGGVTAGSSCTKLQVDSSVENSEFLRCNVDLNSSGAGVLETGRHWSKRPKQGRLWMLLKRFKSEKMRGKHGNGGKRVDGLLYGEGSYWTSMSVAGTVAAVRASRIEMK